MLQTPRIVLDGCNKLQSGNQMLQNGSRTTQDASKWPHNGPQRRLRTAQCGPGVAPRCRKVPPGWLKMAQEGLRRALRDPKMAPRRHRREPKRHQKEIPSEKNIALHNVEIPWFFLVKTRSGRAYGKKHEACVPHMMHLGELIASSWSKMGSR